MKLNITQLCATENCAGFFPSSVYTGSMKHNLAPIRRLSPPHLMAAAAKLLRPVVKLPMHFHVTYTQLISMLKALTIEVAVAEFKLTNRRQSDSLINLIKWAQPKDMKRLRNQPSTKAIDSSSASIKGNIAAKSIQRWQRNEHYQDDVGNPMPLSSFWQLPLRRGKSTRLSFEQFLKSICKEVIRPKVNLNEWIRLGIARGHEDVVELKAGSRVPAGLNEKLEFFGQNIQDHLEAGSQNLLGCKPAYLDRSIFYDRLSLASVAQLSDLADKLGMEALQKMNSKAMQLQSQDEALEDRSFRMNFGVFNFNDANKFNCRLD